MNRPESARLRQMMYRKTRPKVPTASTELRRRRSDQAGEETEGLLARAIQHWEDQAVLAVLSRDPEVLLVVQLEEELVDLAETVPRHRQ